MERVRVGTTGIPFSQWFDFVPTLFAALKLSPTIMAIQLSCLVVRESRPLAGPDEWIFNEVQCRVLFGDVDMFVAMMREETQGIEIDPRVSAVLTRKTTPSADENDDDRNSADEDVGDYADEDDEAAADDK